MIYNKFNFNHFIIFTICFVLFTIIGTLLHEYGHILVAKSYGYKTYLHYGSMHSNIGDDYEKLDTSFEKLNKAKYEEIKTALKILGKRSFYITLGGPAQTIITGLLGLSILYFRRNRNSIKFLLIDWLAVFLALFWLREVFNLFMGLLRGLFNRGNYFGGDEYFLSTYLDLPNGAFSITLGSIGLFISLMVIFKIIPKKKRFTFIVSGLTGGLLGFYWWMYVIGPVLLP